MLVSKGRRDSCLGVFRDRLQTSAGAPSSSFSRTRVEPSRARCSGVTGTYLVNLAQSGPFCVCVITFAPFQSVVRARGSPPYNGRVWRPCRVKIEYQQQKQQYQHQYQYQHQKLTTNTAAVASSQHRPNCLFFFPFLPATTCSRSRLSSLSARRPKTMPRCRA